MQAVPQDKSRAGRIPENEVQLLFTSKPENVGFARTAVALVASQRDLTVDQLDEIKVAVSEAVSNAVIHGYRDTSGMIQVDVKLYEDELEVVVTDKGTGIEDIEWAMQPTNTTDKSRMGLGLSVIKEFMDDLTITSRPGAGTRVYMAKKLAPASRP
ncbi:MAG TPA: anti-sigma F factor [Firmicutes bacterium]|nr:anti-sigma F factor [Bacillota bacterium]